MMCECRKCKTRYDFITQQSDCPHRFYFTCTCSKPLHERMWKYEHKENCPLFVARPTKKENKGE